MNKPLPAALLCFIALARASAADIPSDYKLLYSQDFSKADAIRDFVMTDPKAWRIATEGDKPALELFGKSKYEPPVRSPLNIALVGGKTFGDFIIEAECLQTGKEYGHRDMVIVFGFQSPSQFYYTHIATKTDDHANNIFIVKDAPRLKISTQTNAGNDWGLHVWHNVRVERRLADGTIKVFFDDMTKPIQTAADKTFGAGWIGFGSFDDTGKITRIKVWGPAAEDKTAPAFQK